MKAILTTKNIRKFFGGLSALNDVSLEVNKGLLTMIIGPNGSGKTTLINVISGTLKPDYGKIYFERTDITGWEPHRINKIGIARTFQIARPFAKLTVLENLLIAAGEHIGERVTVALSRGKWIKYEEELVERAFTILSFLDLDHLWNRPANELSGGQLKLLEVGRILMNRPKLILMDEPIAGVNPKLAHEIFQYLTEIKKKFSTTLLIVEHRLDIALDYSDYVFAMHRGRVIAKGDPSEVTSHPKVIESYLGV